MRPDAQGHRQKSFLEWCLMVSAFALTRTSLSVPPILSSSLPLPLSLSLYLSKVLALQTEAEKEKAEAKRKIAKLEEALRYDGKRLNRELCWIKDVSWVITSWVYALDSIDNYLVCLRYFISISASDVFPKSNRMRSKRTIRQIFRHKHNTEPTQSYSDVVTLPLWQVHGESRCIITICTETGSKVSNMSNVSKHDFFFFLRVINITDLGLDFVASDFIKRSCLCLLTLSLWS